MKVGHRLFLAVVPAVLGVLLVAALAYWGQRLHEAPRWIVFVAAIAALGSLWMAWRNTRYVTRRIEGLAAGVGPGARAGRAHAGADEIDSIERAVDSLSSAVSLAANHGRRQEEAAAQRVHDYAALVAEASSIVQRQLEEVRLPLHILLDTHFGDLNENQEEMIGAARAAADVAATQVARLHELAEVDCGTMPPRRDAIRPGDLIQSLLPTLVARGERQGVRVSADIAPALPRITGDRAQLQQALDLLLGARVARAADGSEVRIGMEGEQGRLTITARHGTAPVPSVEEALARRLIATHDGTVAERDGQTVITLPMR